MGNYGSDRRGRSGGRGGGRGGSDRQKLFDAVCASCGNDCQVPFQPRSGKPVYCSECFEGVEGGSSRSSGRSFRSERPSFSDRGGRRDDGNDKLMRKMDFIENKLDKVLELLGGE